MYYTVEEILDETEEKVGLATRISWVWPRGFLEKSTTQKSELPNEPSELCLN